MTRIPLTIVRLDVPSFHTVLMLSRTPLFLRFTRSGGGAWDALDQLTDKPQPDEQLIAARLVDRGSVHVDRTVNGRRVGQWHPSADYQPLAEQPEDAVMRDAASWQQFCLRVHAALQSTGQQGAFP